MPKFSQFTSQASPQDSDEVVGLRSTTNSRFTLSAIWSSLFRPKLTSTPVTIVEGGTGAATAAAARTALGLGNVDNTSDANKPVSTAQAAAIALKLDADEKGVPGGVAEQDAATLRWQRSHELTRWASEAFAPPPAVDTPVVTYESTGTIGGTTTREKRVGDVTGGDLDITGDTHFRYKGFPSAVAVVANPSSYVNTGSKPGGSSQAAFWPLCVEFETAAPQIELRCRAAANAPRFALRVNGRWITEQDIVFSAVTAGNNYLIKLAFPSARMRRIELTLVARDGWGGVNHTSGYSIIRPTEPITRRVAIIGDSITNGSGLSPTGATLTETYARRLGTLLGADELILAGIGGTGWVQTINSEAASTFGGRVSTVLAMSPHVVIFCGSRNDSASASAIQAAVEAALAECAAVQEVYVAGTITALATQNNAVSAGAAAAGRPFFDLSTSIYGTGRSGATTGDGNADYFIGTDGVHPTHEGHKFLDRRFFMEIMGVPDQVAAPIPQKGYAVAAYAAGTAYSLTNSSAALDFSTTDPSITLSQPGIYLLRASVQLKANAATISGETVALKLRRTNNTAADVPNATRTITPPAMTTATQTISECALPDAIYTATAGDVIALYGNVSATLSAGTIDAVDASIVAIRIY